MANIQALADAAVRKRIELTANVGPTLVIVRAIEAQGIRHKPDVDRLVPQVREELKRRGVSLVKHSRVRQ